MESHIETEKADSPVGADRHRLRSLRSVLGMTLILVLAVIASGCSVVLTSAPLPAVDDASLEEQIAGTWLSEGEIMQIRFVEPGFARTASLDWEDDQFVIVPGELTVSRSEGRTFTSLRFFEDGEWAPRYWFAEIEFVDDVLLVWPPVEDAFAAAVEQGTLVADTESDLTITSSPDQLLAMLGTSSVEFFETRDPLILRKVHEGESAPRPDAHGEATDSLDHEPATDS